MSKKKQNKDNQNEVPHNIHDQVFYELMSNREFAIGIYKNYLPKEILDKIDFDTIELINLSGISVSEKDHKTYKVDVVHSVRCKDGSPLWLWCHIEHQTKAEKFMALRVLHYQCGKLLEYPKLNKCDKLPPIVTIIYHQGKVAYSHSVDVYDLFSDREMAKKYFGKPILVDLPSIPDQKLLANEAIGPAEMVLKYIRISKFQEKYAKIIQEMRILDDKTRETLIYYLMHRADIEEEVLRKTLLENLPDDEEIIMTVGQQIEQRGMQRGMQQGMQQGVYLGHKQVAKKMLLRNVDLEIIAEDTGLSIAEIKALQSELEPTKH